jgi:hypothetical protein
MDHFDNPQHEGLRSRLNKPLAKSANWKFQDSWATNISTIGAGLGTLLSTSGLLSSLLPGVSTTPFLVMNVIFLAMIGAAPVIFNALTVDDTNQPTDTTVGTNGGFLLGGLFTIAAALGELAAIGLLFTMGGLTAAFWVAFSFSLLGALIVCGYAYRTLLSGVEHGRAYREVDGAEVKVAPATAAADQTEKAGLRVALP